MRALSGLILTDGISNDVCPSQYFRGRIKKETRTECKATFLAQVTTGFRFIFVSDFDTRLVGFLFDDSQRIVYDSKSKVTNAFAFFR